MAIDSKKVYTTPTKGIFRFPNLIAPDYGTDKHPKVNGEFNVQVMYSEEGAASLMKILEPVYEEARAFAADAFAKMGPASRKKLGEMQMNPLFADVYEKGAEEPTGDLSFKFSTHASGVNKKGEKWVKKVPMFDAGGKPILRLASIWGGTKGKVSFTVAPYFVEGTGTGGLKMYLNAVQIIDLVAGGGGDAGQFGFGAEDGYEQPETEAEQNGFADEESGSGRTLDDIENF